jgi:hypothetical protein
MTKNKRYKKINNDDLQNTTKNSICKENTQHEPHQSLEETHKVGFMLWVFSRNWWASCCEFSPGIGGVHVVSFLQELVGFML